MKFRRTAASIKHHIPSPEGHALDKATVNDLLQAFEGLDISVLLIGYDDGIIRYINSRVSGDLDRSRNEILFSHYKDIFWPEFITIFDKLISDCKDGDAHTSIYYWGEKALWEQVTASIVDVGSTPTILLSITHVSEITRSEYKLENIAYFDNLLKLPNGEKLEEDINELANLETVALISFSLDRLEEINNIYGWDNGNSLLEQIRDWLLFSESRRSQLYRVHGGFALLGRNTSLRDAQDRAEEILQRFSKPWKIIAAGNVVSVYCTAKLGIVYGKYVKNEMRSLLMRTSRSVNSNYEYALYDENTDKEAKRALLLRDTLINCIFTGMKGFSVHYQPIADRETGRWVAVEALCRWQMPDGNNVSPAEFIPIAEQLGLIDELDQWVRTTSIAQCASLGLEKEDFLLNINFSPSQRIDDEFIGRLLGNLERNAFPADKLNLEVTESVKMRFDDHNIQGFRRLSESGVKLSLDDFGTGYSSFENLIKLPARILKIDRLFVDEIVTDQYKQYVLTMTVNLAHYLGMRVIVEGIETREQMDILQASDADYIQGYYLSRPLTYDQLRQRTDRFKSEN